MQIKEKRSKYSKKRTRAQLLSVALRDQLEIIRLLSLTGEVMQTLIEEHNLWDDNKQAFDKASMYINEAVKIQEKASYVITE